MHSTSEFFMTELKVRKVLSNLKIKNCEGIDRIPLRVLNEGAEILHKPISQLFKLIYETKKSSLLDNKKLPQLIYIGHYITL